MGFHDSINTKLGLLTPHCHVPHANDYLLRIMPSRRGPDGHPSEPGERECTGKREVKSEVDMYIDLNSKQTTKQKM